jgi:hypothetical protein
MKKNLEFEVYYFFLIKIEKEIVDFEEFED